MQTYIGLLRGINVGGHKKIKMADLKLLFETIGFIDVTTYIQSGNVVFSTSEKKNNLVQLISEEIQKQCGFEVPILVKATLEVEMIVANCPFSEENKIASYFTLLNEAPSKNLMKEVSKLTSPNEEFVITENCVYFFSEKGYNDVKFNNNFFEKKLKVVSTTRNYRTLAKLLELAK